MKTQQKDEGKKQESQKQESQKQESKKQRSQYHRHHAGQNLAYMCRLAWRKGKWVLVIVIGMAALTVAANAAQLLIAPTILSKVEQRAPLSELLLTIALFAGSMALLAALKNYILPNKEILRANLRIDCLRKIHWKLCTTAYPNTENPEFLKLLENADRTARTPRGAAEAIYENMEALLANLGSFAVYLLLLTAVDKYLMLAVLGTSVISYLFGRKVNQWGYRHREEEAEYAKKMRYTVDKAGDRKIGKDIRVFGMQDWLDDVYQSAFSLYEDFMFRRERAYFAADVVDLILTIIRNGLAYGYLITMVLKQGMTASQFLLYFSAVSGFASWVGNILEELSKLHKNSLDISGLREFLEYEEPFLGEEGEPVVRDLAAGYEIKLEDVSFRYPGAKQDTIHHMNLTIHAGEKLAVVGLNGAGKTTLIKLICGFYDPTEGRVLLNGRDIREFNRKDYYRLFSAVFQQFSVLEASVKENVTQEIAQPEASGAAGVDGKPAEDRSTLAHMEQCLAQAGLTAKVQSLPQGYDTHIGRQIYDDGVELSGGELQRLMLARALYKDSPIIILDEPTAALDPVAENDIYQKYHELTAGRTSVYISHRLASTRFCDRIIFLEAGRIVEEGTHSSLMNASGKYAQLYEMQSRYYREGGAADV